MQLTNIHSNFLPSVMVGLRNRFGLQQFVETGTCSGGTTTLAALAFPKVLTVEIAPNLYATATANLRGLPHVQSLLADSRDVLRATDWSAEPPTLFYLDAHRETAGEIDGWAYPVPCPLLEELTIIGGLYDKHCIVMDDYKLDYVMQIADLWPQVYGFNGKERILPSHHQWCAITPGPCDWQQWVEL